MLHRGFESLMDQVFCFGEQHGWHAGMNNFFADCCDMMRSVKIILGYTGISAQLTAALSRQNGFTSSLACLCEPVGHGRRWSRGIPCSAPLVHAPFSTYHSATTAFATGMRSSIRRDTGRNTPSHNRRIHAPHAREEGVCDLFINLNKTAPR